MPTVLRQLRRITFLIGLTMGVSVSAQTLFVGPSAWYLMSSSLPEGTDSESQPTRYLVGASTLWQVSKKATLRATLGYRSEEGTFATPESSLVKPNVVYQPRNIQVVVGPGSEPSVLSSITASSVELTAALCFPILPLDTSGSELGISLGGVADLVMSASQVDDYTAISSHKGADIITYAYSSQVGYGALIGAYLALPLGSNKLCFDMQYVFRAPTTMNVATAPFQQQETSWLIGKGLRAGLTFYFALF